MPNTGNTQQQINYGAAANNGQGDPLRTAFIKTDDNFDSVWLAGPVGSNITIGNNTIQSNNTNGNIILKPNGTGIIQANASIIPNADNTRDLGSSTQAWRRAYIDELLPDSLTVSGDAVIGGNLTVEGDTIQIGNITTDTLTIQLANTAANATAANGAGITVGANDDIATILYNATANRWNVSVGMSAVGNISAPYFLGNGSQLTGMYGNANVAANLAALAGNPISTTGNVSTGTLFVTGNFRANSSGNVWNISNDFLSFPSGASWRSDRFTLDEYISSAVDGYLNISTFDNTANVATELHMEHGIVQLNIYNGNNVTWEFDSTGNLTLPANTFAVNYANGSAVNLNTYGNANVAANLAAFSNNPISTTGNVSTGNIVATGAFTANSSGNVWSMSNDILSFPSGASWRSDKFTLDEYISSAVDGYLNISTYDNTANVATELHMEHGIIQFNIYNGALKTWAFDQNGSTTFPGDLLPSANLGGNLGSSSLYWSNLWVANNTIYIGGVPVGMTAGNVLTVDGNTITGTVTFSNEAVIGTGTSNTVSGLYLAPDPGAFTDGMYLRVRGNTISEATHIHFDTGNNQYFSQFIGDDNKYVELANTGNIVINTSDYAGNTAQWNFGTDGNLTLPYGAVIRDTAGNAVAFGLGAGLSNQNNYAVAIGPAAGNDTQGVAAVAVGSDAGQTSQGIQAIAIGTVAGANAQGISAVAIGPGAGQASQGQFAVALGYGAGDTNQGNNSIIINATGATLDQTTANTFTVAPIRNDVANVAEILFYDTTSKEITYGNTISVAGNITGGNISTTGNITGADVVSANTFVSNAFNVVTAGNLSITSQYGLGFTGTILEDNGTLELIGSGGGGVVVGWDSTYGNGLGNIATVNFNEVGGEGILLRTGNRAATEYNWNFDSTGNLTLPGNITGNTGGFAIGYRDIPQVSFTGNATIATTDAGKHFYSTQSTDYVLTIANNASQGFQTGAAITVVNQGTGNITLAQGSGVTLYLAGNATSGNRTVATFGMATIMKVATDTWFINGTGVS